MFDLTSDVGNKRWDLVWSTLEKFPFNDDMMELYLHPCECFDEFIVVTIPIDSHFDCFISFPPGYTCLVESLWHVRASLISKNGACTAERWAFIADYLFLRSHFGHQLYIHVAQQLGMRIPERVYDQILVWDQQARKESQKRSSDEFKWKLAFKRKEKERANQTAAKVIKQFNLKPYGSISVSVKSSASSSSSSASASSSSSSPVSSSSVSATGAVAKKRRTAEEMQIARDLEKQECESKGLHFCLPCQKGFKFSASNSAEISKHENTVGHRNAMGVKKSSGSDS